MNIIRTLDMALPELQERRAQSAIPRMEPGLIAREHVEEGELKLLVLKPRGEGFYRLTPMQWKLLNLFDGKRTIPEIAAMSAAETGEEWSAGEVQEFADTLADTDLMQRRAVDKSAALLQSLEEQRKRRRRSKWGDLSEVNVAAWDPDVFLTRLYPFIRFLFTPQFNLFAILMVGIMLTIFMGHWSDIWHDTLEFYNLSDKGLRDFIEVWVLFSFVAFFHESAHGCTVKHYGGEVHRMGFMLMYFLPCFFCDSTEVYVYGDKWARIYTALAGIWSELIFCSLVTVVWWATSPGMWIHDVAYLLIVITGVGVVILNINPLVKLDGYFVFSELVGVTDLKEKSTSFLTSWCKRHICGLPVEVDRVPQKRRALFIAYGIASGVYCYLLLFVIVELTYHVAQRFSPDWAWAPALLLALKVFQSRLKAAGKFMKIMYLDKKERLQGYLTPTTLTCASVIALALIFAPIWPDSIEGRFELEPAHKAVIRAEVPGEVDRVLVKEGQAVTVGAAIVSLRDLALESEAAQVHAELGIATARTAQAQLRYAGYGSAEQERQRLSNRHKVLLDQVEKLEVKSPISGVVVTPRLENLAGSYLKAGSTIAEVDDLSAFRARIYVPGISVRYVSPGDPVTLKMDAQFWPRKGRVLSVASITSALPEGLIETEKKYQGFRGPQYFAATLEVAADSTLREGMPGTGKIRVGRRSLAGFAWRFVRESVARKLW
jgi:putative peptide zinc metalloprotease protein